MEALTKKYDDLVVQKVDIKKWGTPVAVQFNIKGIPYLEVYDKKGEQKYKGRDAMAYIQRLEKKAKKKKKKA